MIIQNVSLASSFVRSAKNSKEITYGARLAKGISFVNNINWSKVGGEGVAPPLIIISAGYGVRG